MIILTSAQLKFVIFRIMSDQDNLLGSVRNIHSRGRDHLLNLSDLEEEPMDESGATFRGLRQPSAYRGRDLYYKENP